MLNRKAHKWYVAIPNLLMHSVGTVQLEQRSASSPKQPVTSSPAPQLTGLCKPFSYHFSNWKTSDFVSFQITLLLPFLCGVLPLWAIWCLSSASNPESWKPAHATLWFLSLHRVHDPGACAAEKFLLLEEIKLDLFTPKSFWGPETRPWTTIL